MILSCLFFSLMGVGVKFSTRTLPLFEVVFFRSIISALILGILIKRRHQSLRGFNEKVLLQRGLASFLALLCNFYAISKIPLADASVLTNSSPLFAVILSVIFLKEKLNGRLLFLLFLSVIGIFFILKPTLDWWNIPSLVALAAAFFAAIAFVIIHQLHETESSLTIAFYFAVVASFGSLPLMLINFQMPVGMERWFLVFMGVCGTFGQVYLCEAYKNEQVSWITSLIYTTVLFAFLWGILFFGEIPDRYSLIGTLLTVASCIAIIRLRKT